MRGDYFPQVTYTLFGEIALNVFHLSFARHPQSCVERELVDLLSSTLAQPASETTWTACRELSQSKNTPVSKIYCLLMFLGVFFFPSALIMMWTFQPSFEIGMGMSIQSIRNSTSMLSQHTIAKPLCLSHSSSKYFFT